MPATDRDSPSLGRVLEALEGATRYRDWIFSLAAPYLGGRVLEVGAGIGTMLECVLDRDVVVALEVEPPLAAELKRRFGDTANVRVIEASINDPAALEEIRSCRVDSAMTFNVLEHIEDDVTALASIASSLEPGGNLAVFVPAFPGIYGAMDRGVGHVRRYRRPELVHKMGAAGFDVKSAHFVNLPGYFAWYLNGRVLRSDSPAGGPRMVSLYDRTVIAATRRLERRVHPPFGASVFVAGTKR